MLTQDASQRRLPELRNSRRSHSFWRKKTLAYFAKYEDVYSVVTKTFWDDVSQSNADGEQSPVRRQSAGSSAMNADGTAKKGEKGSDLKLLKTGIDTPLRTPGSADILKSRRTRVGIINDPRSNPTLVKRFVKANAFVYSTIVSTLAEECMKFMDGVPDRDGVHLWDVINNEFRRPTNTNIRKTLSEYFHLKQKRNEKIGDYQHRNNDLIENLTCYGVEINPLIKVVVFMDGLNEKYLQAKIVLNMQDELTFSTATEKLKEYEISHLNNSKKRETDQALAVLKSVKNVICYRCNQKGHYRNKCSLPRQKCLHCGGDHLSDFCRKMRAQPNNSGDKKLGEARAVNPGTKSNPGGRKRVGDSGRSQPKSRGGHGDEGHGIDFGLAVRWAAPETREKAPKSGVKVVLVRWCVDSGASSHFCNVRNVFEDFDSTATRDIKIANGTLVTCQGKGKIGIFNDVWYCPSLDLNLLSISALSQDGYDVSFRGDRCLVKKNGRTVLAPVKDSNLYYVWTRAVLWGAKGKSYGRASSVSDARINPALLWHRRLGHINFNALRKINVSHNLGIPAKAFKDLRCPVCLSCKSCHKPFAKEHPHKTTRPLQLVSMDLAGPVRTPSVGGAIYFLICVDHATKFAWVRFLAKKSEAASSVLRFVKSTRGPNGEMVLRIITDNGGEFTSNELTASLEDSGVSRLYVAPYSSQSNGLAERMIRIITEMGRCMIKASRLPQSLWAEAVSYAVYTRNRLPVRSLDGKTPYEMYYGFQPPITHLRTFGASCYVPIPMSLRAKRDRFLPIAQRAVFLSMSDQNYGYRILLIDQKQVVCRRSVHFDETNEIPDLSDFRRDSHSTIRVNSRIPDFHLPPADRSSSPGEDSDDESKDDDDERSAEDRTEAMDADLKDGTTENGPKPNAALIKRFESDQTNSDEEPTKPMDDDRDAADTEQEIDTLDDQNANLDSTHNDSKCTRARRPRVHFAPMISHFANAVMDGARPKDPSSYSEAIQRDDSDKWKEAMKNEIDALQRNGTWRIVKRERKNKLMKCRWVFTRKYDSEGNVTRYKARLVAKGYSQGAQPFQDTFAPTIKSSSLRALFALGARPGWSLSQGDINNAYLHGTLPDPILMSLPPGLSNLTSGVPEGSCIKLIKSLYGTKTAGNIWSDVFASWMKKQGFKRLSSDPCVYKKQVGDKILTVGVYVDDCIALTNCKALSNAFFAAADGTFGIKNEGELSWVLGLKIERNDDRIAVSQAAYIEQLLTRHNMDQCRPAAVPLPSGMIITNDPDGKAADPEEYRSMIGGMMYLMTNTRPDLAYPLSTLARYMNSPKDSHMAALNHLFRYVKGTSNHSLIFSNDGNAIGLTCYVDASFASCRDTRRSVSGYLYFLNGNLISWASKRQTLVALSTAEAEYIALSASICEGKHLYQFLDELGMAPSLPIKVKEDNQAAIKISTTVWSSARTKHINLRYHHVRENVKSGQFSIEYVSTSQQLADSLTKPSSSTAIAKLMDVVMKTVDVAMMAMLVISSDDPKDDITDDDEEIGDPTEDEREDAKPESKDKSVIVPAELQSPPAPPPRSDSKLSAYYPFYAIAKGYNGYQGVVRSWAMAKVLVNRVPGAVFKRFNTLEQAMVFIRDYNSALLMKRMLDAQ